MAEFQKKKAHEDLLSALGKMGLQVSPDLTPAGSSGTATGPGGTAAVSHADIIGARPNYMPPAPAEAVPALPLDPPPAD